MQLKVQKLHPGAILPKYQTLGAACFDLHALAGFSQPAVKLAPGDTLTLRTGLAFEIPQGHVMLVFSRSGHGFKNDVRLSNCVGVIDSDYRGELLVKLCNDQPKYSPTPFGSHSAEDAFTAMVIRPSDRIAQAMIVPIPRVELIEVDELSTTERGASGIGSTGR